MPETLAPPDSIAGRADPLPPAFDRSWSDDGLDRVFALSGGAGGVEIYDVDPLEPPVQVLLRLAAEGLAA